MPMMPQRPSMKQDDHPAHNMPESGFDGTVLNPNTPNPGQFSDNRQRFTRDENESNYPYQKYEKDM